MHLKVEDVVDGPGRAAVRKRRPTVDHFVGYDPQGPPVALHSIGAVGSAVHGGQHLGGEEVLSPDRHGGGGHLFEKKEESVDKAQHHSTASHVSEPSLKSTYSFAGSQPGSGTEVCQFNVARAIDENILWFDVSASG